MAYTLNENLKRWAEQYETAEFIQSDPVQIPRRYITLPTCNNEFRYKCGENCIDCMAYHPNNENIEISAFVTAWIAWGSRKQIIQKADFIDREIFKGAPYHYIVGTDTQGAAPEWRQYKGSTESFYRTFTFGDFHDLCARLFHVYTNWESMEAAIKYSNDINGEPSLQTLFSLFGSVNGIPDGSTSTACKRLCLFLRWMCRKGSPVDFGLWTVCEPRNLIIPLDTHVHKQAIRLGLTTRRTSDLRTAIEITDRFAEIFPDDPTKGDFALFGYGVNNGKVSPVTEEPEKEKEQPTPVADLSIADVLKMPLFFDNVKTQLMSLWNDRETARKKAAKDNQRLKAHVIDRMHNAGDWEPGKFVVIFATILDKVATGYSSNEREFIRAVGMTAFNITMQKLIDDEKKRDNSDGNDKQ